MTVSAYSVEPVTATSQSSVVTQARALGPWSSARQLVEGRAAALSAREDKIAAAALAAAEAEAAADWMPKRDHRLGPRPSQRVGRLFDMCLDLLVEYIEDIETLYGLPSAIKVTLHFWQQLLN